MQNKDQSTPSGSGEESSPFTKEDLDLLQDVAVNVLQNEEFNQCADLLNSLVQNYRNTRASRTQGAVGREDKERLLDLITNYGIVNYHLGVDTVCSVERPAEKINERASILAEIKAALSALHSNPLTPGE